MSTPIDQPAGFPEALQQALDRAHVSIEGFRQQHGIALQRNVLGHERMTREKFDRVLRALPLDPEHAAVLIEAYEGSDCSTIRGVVSAGIRRHTQQGLAKKAEISVSSLTYIRGGDPRRREGGTHEIRWATWKSIADALDVHPFQALKLWRKDTREVLQEEGYNIVLGQEAELIIRRRPEHSSQQWREHPPVQFAQWTVRKRLAFLREVRAGVLRSWGDMQSFLDATASETTERFGMAAAWIGSVRATYAADMRSAFNEESAVEDMLSSRKAYLREAYAASKAEMGGD